MSHRPHNRPTLFARLAALCGLAAITAGWGLLLAGCFSLGGGAGAKAAKAAEDAKAALHKATDESAFFAGAAHALVPDTHESYWYVGVLAAICFVAGVLAVLASFFGAAIASFFGLGVGGLVGAPIRRAGFQSIALGILLAAVEYFLHAYLRVMVFASVIVLVLFVFMWARAHAFWGVFKRGAKLVDRANDSRDTGVRAADVRSGVAIMATVSPTVMENRVAVLEAAKAGVPAVIAAKATEPEPKPLLVEVVSAAPAAGSGFNPGAST